MAMEEHEEREIDLMILLGDIIKIARLHFLLCVLLVAAAGSFFAFWAYRTYVPRYTASVSFSVRMDNPLYGSVASYHVATAEQLAKTFPHVLTSGVLQERVQNHLGISRMPSIGVTTSTSGSMINISVTDQDPELAWDVLNAVIVYYPEIAEYVVGPTKLILLHESGVPTQPSNTLDLKNAAVRGAASGFALWAVLVVCRALMISTVHNEKELKDLVNAPCIGQLPYINRSTKKGGMLLYRNIRSAGFGEAVRLLRMRVEKAMQQHSRKVLLISSAIPGEGKTTISVNLALSLAHKGRRVLIIDCDLRNPSVARTLGMTGGTPIREYLEGRVEMDAVVSATAYQNLYMVSGDTARNPAIKPGAMERMRDLVEAARQQFDIVILDTPPCSLLADASEFAVMADCGLMVVRQEYATREQILDGIQRLSDANLPLIGCAMNYTNRGTADGYGYGYGYGYGHSYGYGHGYGNKKK